MKTSKAHRHPALSGAHQSGRDWREGWAPWYRCASKVDAPCTGCADSTSDSEPEHWEWDHGKAGSCCRSVLEPMLWPQPIVPFQPELPSQVLPSQPLQSYLSGCDCSFGHSFRPTQRGTFARPQPFGSGTSSSSPPMSTPAKPWEVDAQERSRRARRLLVQVPLWAPSTAERDTILEAVAEWPRPQRGGAHTLAGASSRQLCRYYGVPKRDRRRHRRSGELRAQSCECFKKHTTFHFTSSHHVTPCTQPS